MTSGRHDSAESGTRHDFAKSYEEIHGGFFWGQQRRRKWKSGRRGRIARKLRRREWLPGTNGAPTMQEQSSTMAHRSARRSKLIRVGSKIQEMKWPRGLSCKRNRTKKRQDFSKIIPTSPFSPAIGWK